MRLGAALRPPSSEAHGVRQGPCPEGSLESVVCAGLATLCRLWCQAPDFPLHPCPCPPLSRVPTCGPEPSLCDRPPEAVTSRGSLLRCRGRELSAGPFPGRESLAHASARPLGLLGPDGASCPRRPLRHTHRPAGSAVPMKAASGSGRLVTGHSTDRVGTRPHRGNPD